jgi:proline iminopeptidase
LDGTDQQRYLAGSLVRQTNLHSTHSSETYSQHIPEDERHDLISAYSRRLTSDDDQVSLEAAKHWSTWEVSTNMLVQNPAGIKQAQEDVRWTRAFARIENHYFTNKAGYRYTPR